MDGNGFIASIENNLVTLAPITKYIINKQLTDLNVNKEHLTPEQALEFINRMSNALVMCLGKDGSQLARKMMIKQLRTYAPTFFGDNNSDQD
jgi:hypothetical protein